MFSDIAWERHIIAEFPDIQFYDYTKNPRRVPATLSNYHLTFSRSETNEKDCVRVLENGGNVAVTFADTSRNFVGNRSGLQALPGRWKGFRVVDGDTSDLRFEDEQGVVVGLRLKAHSTIERTRAIDSGFAVVVGDE